MMVKRLILSLIVSFGILSAGAATVTENEALSVAQNFLKSGSVKIKSTTSSSVKPTLAYTAETKSADAAFYVFNYGGDNGYVLVSGDDRAVPVLGYADSGAFNYSQMPDNMKWWLQQYAQEIEYLQSQPDEAYAASTEALSTSVAPLLGSTAWDQSSPYNNLCPTYTSGTSTYRCATGCVATAMAQIMYYHKWPERGTGSNTYTFSLNGVSSDKKTLSVDFSRSVYDWANMTPTYGSSSTQASNDAVARLMYDCGVSVNMGYGASSGAATIAVIGALADYFGYDKSINYIRRDITPASTWNEIIRTELNASRPVLYCGSNPQVGHAFVFDGYNSNGYFHVNWGWSGVSNGYFLTTALDPSSQGTGGSNSGYNDTQGICINIMKDAGGTPTPHASMSSALSASVAEVALGADFTLKFTGFSMVYPSASPTNIYVGVNIIKEDGTEFFKNGSSIGNLSLGYIYGFSTTLSLPASMPVGKYKILACHSFDGTNYDNTEVPFNQPQYLALEVKDGKAYFTTPTNNESVLTKSNLSIEGGKVYAKRSFLAKATVTNTGGEYYDYLSLALVNRFGGAMATTAATLVDIEKGKPFEFQGVIDAQLPAGTYYLDVLDKNNKSISGTRLTVTVLAEPENAAELQIAETLTPTQTFVSETKAKVKVKNTGGFFGGNLELMILSESGSSILQIMKSQFVSLDTDETKEISFGGYISGGEVGKTYKMVLRDPSDATKYYTWGDIIPFTLTENSGVSNVNKADASVRIYPNPATEVVNVESESEITNVSIFSMLGVQVANIAVGDENNAQIDVSNLTSGQYIVRIINAAGVSTKSLIKK